MQIICSSDEELPRFSFSPVTHGQITSRRIWNLHSSQALHPYAPTVKKAVKMCRKKTCALPFSEMFFQVCSTAYDDVQFRSYEPFIASYAPTHEVSSCIFFCRQLFSMLLLQKVFFDFLTLLYYKYLAITRHFLPEITFINRFLLFTYFNRIEIWQFCMVCI